MLPFAGPPEGDEWVVAGVDPAAGTDAGVLQFLTRLPGLPQVYVHVVSDQPTPFLVTCRRGRSRMHLGLREVLAAASDYA